MEEETSVILRDLTETKETKAVQETVAKSDKEKSWLEVNAMAASSLAEFRNSIEEIYQSKQDNTLLKDSPMSVGMSVEKSLTYSSSSNEGKNEYRNRREPLKEVRINFFDVDEYRADIFNYLRVTEVCILFVCKIYIN